MGLTTVYIFLMKFICGIDVYW